ncbi:MAG: DNA methyltransferase [Planctomycetota bacterium]|jgi:hypothetical protein
MSDDPARAGLEAPEGQQGELFQPSEEGQRTRGKLGKELARFRQFGGPSHIFRSMSKDGRRSVETFANEFWTSKQRAADSLHELSYRACFKPQLPRFFIERLTGKGDRVYDPFMGRGTTLLEAALLGRSALGNDINPLSQVMLQPRMSPPSIEAIGERLAALDLRAGGDLPEDLLTFYHPDTLQEICSLRSYLCAREAGDDLDDCDRWIRMVALNRLTGHSPGFFSVYTMPPNQAVSVSAQRKINARRSQVPEARDVRALILRKSRSLLSRGDKKERARLAECGPASEYYARPADATPEIPDASVRLVVTSPPFLDVVQYRDDNWLRCWFCDIDVDAVDITILRKLEEWQEAMTRVFVELKRVLEPGGQIAFEVGEVRGGQIKLEEIVLCCGLDAGLEAELILINEQQFTKTANCWGVSNNKKGTNSNRVVLFRKS